MRGALAAKFGHHLAEYAVVLAVILVIVVGRIRLVLLIVGSNANNVFSNAANSIQ